MKTRIGTTFGLALMVALGIMAVMLALGMFSFSKVNAADGGNAVHIDHVVNTAVNVPNTPGEIATYTVTFQNQRVLTTGSGQLHVKFAGLISVPSSIEKERITISASGSGTSIGLSNPTVDPTISTDSLGNRVVVITIGDAFPADAAQTSLPIWDTASTNPNAGHVITFSPLAGIRNPTFSSVNGAWVDMSDNGVTYNVTPQEIPVYRYLSMSLGTGPRNSTVTITGEGFADGGTATVFLDTTNGGNIRALDSGEAVLATSDAAIAAGEFTATFTVDTNFGVGNNSINAIDGSGASANNPDIGARFSSQDFSLHGVLTLSSSSVTRGGALGITLSDFTGAGPVNLVTIGGVQANLTGLGLTTTNSVGGFTITVPATTPLGTQTVSVTSATEGVVAGVATPRVSTVSVGGLTLIASPSTAVAGQVITVSGSGFTASGTIANNGITVGSIVQPLLSNGSAETTVTMDNSGNLVASFAIPNNDVTRTAGTHILRITDSGNRVGEVNITIPSKTLALDPASSSRASTVSFTGSGYIASNTVTITHGATTVATVTADSAGGISGTFTVPGGSGIPSANGVGAISACTCTSAATGGLAVQLAGGATHSVPGATIVVDPTSAAPGEFVTITGTGFPGFVSLGGLTVGDVSALPSPAPASDGNGAFTISALVPQLAVGPVSLVSTVGTPGAATSVVATTSFTIVAAATVAVVTSDDTADVFAAEVTADNLVRVWWFSNELQAWSFFDPRAAFAVANTYTTATGSDIVWVNVVAETTFQGQTLYPGWNLISLN